MKKDAPFKSEAEMCAVFIDFVQKPRRHENETRWLAYAETGGFDLVLVRKSDGFQIGIEAKLALNAKVLTQALEGKHDREGPDCRAVLVPSGKAEMASIAARCGVTVMTITGGNQYSGGPSVDPWLPDETDRWQNDHWHEQATMKRITLPGYIPDVAAGASAPLKLTQWKIAALKIEALLERRGIVGRADFKALGIDVRRWLPSEMGWLAIDRHGLIAGKGFPNFKNQHPRVYQEILADFDTWAPKVDAAAALVTKPELV